MSTNKSDHLVAPSSSIDNLTEDATLSGGAMNGFIQGRDAVRSFLGTVKALYQDFTIIYQGDTTHYRLQEYTATLEGHPVTGVVTLRKTVNGQYDQVVVNHRPLSSLLLFSSLVIEENHFYSAEDQTLPELLEYADANGFK